MSLERHFGTGPFIEGGTLFALEEDMCHARYLDIRQGMIICQRETGHEGLHSKTFWDFSANYHWTWADTDACNDYWVEWEYESPKRHYIAKRK